MGIDVKRYGVAARCLATFLMSSSALMPLWAEEVVTTQEAPPAVNPLDEGSVLLEADEALFDPDRGLYIARGNVEATHDGRTLMADELTYDQNTNQIIASGRVSIQDENGGVIFAERVELDGALKDGIIYTMGVLLDENTRMAAAKVRREGDVLQMENAVYSPCKVCKSTGDTVPLWRIKALKITHNKAAQSITYSHAYLEFGGIPVFYTPYFSHADPTVPRVSGFLVPRIGNSSDLGNFIETPYHFVLAPNYDMTLTPFLMSEEAPVFKGEFRMRTHSGQFQFDGSVTQPSRRDAFGNTIEGTDNRNHLFGTGRFELYGDWDWGFDVGLTSDDTYLKRYDISDEDVLTNRLYTSRSMGRNYTNIESLYFVSLREKDVMGVTPVVLPNATFEYFHDTPVLGGTLSVKGGGLMLYREEGTDTQRLSIEPSWTRNFSTRNGHLFKLFGHVRADVYHSTELFESTTAVSDKDEEFTARVIPTLGAEWRYPLYRQRGTVTQILEPIAQLALSPYGGNPDEIPNEDSLSFEFDDTNLFSDNRFPGLDRHEDGVRLNIGLQASFIGQGSGENSFMFGQSFRLKESTLFDPTTGLDETNSDYVGRLILSPSQYFAMTHRFRLDKDDLSFRRNEVDLTGGTPDYNLKLGYLKLAAELSASGLEEREELSAETHLKIRGNWSFQANGRRNLADGEMVKAQASFVYKDECTEFEIAVRRRFTRFRDIEPATSIFFRIRLTTLG
ncbi:MAG: LPS-assembly protein LptD [Alphaproteobacteria bacterium]|nr:MAG: LPS-assembly protein LptD [Alphaproteobacteria bacterium]